MTFSSSLFPGIVVVADASIGGIKRRAAGDRFGARGGILDRNKD
jgi:hypothetical protein